jgi:hypothetical protein
VHAQLAPVLLDARAEGGLVECLGHHGRYDGGTVEK